MRIHPLFFACAFLCCLITKAQTVSVSGIINIYTAVTAVSPQSVAVASAAGFNPCDHVLIIQMKGAAINTVNTINYGDITAYNNAGNYEFADISNVSGNAITFLNPLTRAYTVSDLVQLVKVPVYNNVNVSGLLSCAPWNGVTGGILTFAASGTVTLNSPIDVSGKGFVGGVLHNGSYTPSGNSNYVVPAPSLYAGEKGEGIFITGSLTILGRGKNANGGGGGNDLNGGAAGGSNYGAGGLGGNVISSASIPQYVPLVCGGIGGLGLSYSAALNKLFLGGGGGAGQENDNVGTAGGKGGGMILISAAAITGNNSTIQANGVDVPIGSIDGQGGGGAGGTIVLDVPAVQSCTISAKGGNGGADTYTGPDCHGKGGGGGGGVIWTSTPLSGITTVLTGGLPGVFTNPASLCFNTSQGATQGQPGGLLTGISLPVVSFTVYGNTLSCINPTVQLSTSLSSAASYSWSGPGIVSVATASSVSVNAPGIYSVTINNCSTGTIAVLNSTGPISLTVSASATAICLLASPVTLSVSGASAYTWSPAASLSSSVGASVSASPPVTTTYVVQSANGACTASAAITISVIATPTVSVASLTMCSGTTATVSASGAATYSWSPGNLTGATVLISPSATTIYTVVGANSICTNTQQFTVTVINTPTVLIAGTATHICSGSSVTLTAGGAASYTWQPGGANTGSLMVSPASTKIYTLQGANGNCPASSVFIVSVTATPTISAANLTVCSGASVSLSATGATTYSWNPGSLSGASVVVNPASSTVYTLLGANGTCTNTQNVTVTVLPLPTATVFGSGPVCEGLPLSFGVVSSTPVTVSWHGPSAFTSTLQNNLIQTSLLSQSGIYTVGVTNANACTAILQVSLSVVPKPVLSVHGATVCLGETATLNVAGALNYQWYSQGNPVGVSAMLILQPQSAGNTAYDVVGTSVNSCTSSASTNLCVFPLPSASLSVSPKNRVCLNTRLTLTGFGGNYYEWLIPNQSSFTGSTVAFVANNVGFTGDYSLTVSNEFGCRSSTITNIHIDNLPYAGLAANKWEGCVPFCSEFSFYSSSGASAVINSGWELDHKSFPENTFSYCFNTAGDYSIKGSFKDTSTHCVNTATFSVKAFAKPQADFNYLGNLFEDEGSLVFTNASNGGQQVQWSWFFISDTQEHQGEHVVYNFDEAGAYPVAMVVKNTWGCEDTIVKTIQIGSEFSVYVPRAFTPNGDGKNENFHAVTRGVTLFTFMVYDRWGEQLFFTHNTADSWDGRYKGEACKQDAYAWKLSASGANGASKELSGLVTLLR